MSTTEDRTELSAADKKAMDDDAFAYIDSKGGRHLPIHDENHVRAALSRFNQTQFDSPADKAAAAKKIVAAARKFDIEVSADSPVGEAAGLKQMNSARKPHHRAGLPLAPEVRHFRAEGLEIRTGADGSGDIVTVEGSPIVYNAPYSVMDMLGEFEERMHPGVVSDVLTQNQDVRFLFDHDGLPLARTTSGTMTLIDGDTSLRFMANLDLRQQLANDLVIAIERGDISQMSCGFVVANDEWSDDYTQRDIYRFQQMFDVSAVTYPASPTTNISIAQRMLLGAPIESRARVRKVWQISKELRAGKVLSQENADALVNALAALHQADEALASVQNSHIAAGGHVQGVLGNADSAYQGDPDNSEHGASGDPTVAQDGTGTRSEEPAAETRTEEPAPEPSSEVPAKSSVSPTTLRLKLAAYKMGGSVRDAKSSKGSQRAMAPAKLANDPSKPFEPQPYHADADENVVCPQCKKHDDTDARFCDQCGFKLVGATGVDVLAA